MRRNVLGLLVIVLLGLGMAPSDAQGTPQLVKPSVAEYMAAVPDIAKGMDNDVAGQRYRDDDYFALIDTLHVGLGRYGAADFEDVPLKTLLNARPFLRPQSGMEVAITDEPLSEPWWQRRELLYWLQKQKIDLAQNPTMDFNGGVLTATPVDFDGDGKNEYLVEIVVGNVDSPDYHEYVILQPVNAATGNYHLITLLGLWSSVQCTAIIVCKDKITLYKLMDLNGDGKPELAIAVAYTVSGFAAVDLKVLSWRDGGMVDIVAQSGVPESGLGIPLAVNGGGAQPLPDGTWTFPKNSSGTHDILQRRVYSDTMGCEVIHEDTYVWNRLQGRFVLGPVSETLADTAACAMRRGHLAMLALDFPAAAAAYQRVLELMPSSINSTDQEIRQYAEIRLIAALVLSRRSDDALAARSKLLGERPAAEDVGALIDLVRMYSGDADRYVLCAAIANAPVWWSDRPNALYDIGNLDDVPRSRNYSGESYGGEDSGCPIMGILTRFLNTAAVPVTTSPRVFMDEADFPITAQFVADLNGDGRLDWLLWMDQPHNMALIFWSSGDRYQATITYDLNAPSQDTRYRVINLPDKAGVGLVEWSFENGVGAKVCGPNKPYGYLRLLRVKAGNQLDFPDTFLLCEPRSVTELFLDPGTLRVWAVPPIGPQIAVPAIFRWVRETMRFEQFPPYAVIDETQVPIDPLWTCWKVSYHFCGFAAQDGGIPSALTILDEVLAKPSERAKQYSYFMAAARYWRAMLREEAGDTSGALADYYVVYTENPGSAWGKLAALHLGWTF